MIGPRTPKDFAEVLRAYAGEAWTLEAVLLARASGPDKKALVDEACEHHADRERPRDVRRFAGQLGRASSGDLTDDEAKELCATKAPEILVRLAGNPRTPEHLLNELREVRGIPKAREIRSQASRTLRARRKTK